MAAQSNDFMLQFGSNADVFSKKIAEDINPGIEKINALREALEQYDETVGNIKGGKSPLGITFEGLDRAAQRLEVASRDFNTKIEGQINALGTKITGLTETLSGVMRGLRLPPNPGAGGRPLVPPGGRRDPATPDPRRGDQFSPEQRAILAGQRRAPDEPKKTTPPNTTRVTPAEQAAADRQKNATRQSTEAVRDSADANSDSARKIEATSQALDGLNERLRNLIDLAKQMPAAGTAGDTPHTPPTNADAALQIANTTSNPVPVIVVGGEAQAVSGHAPGHQAHMPHATTATQTARAKEEVAAVAEVANAQNSYKNPRHVQPGDVVAQGEYFQLPGQDKPTRAFGIRKEETAGDYSARVDAMRERAAAALAGAPHLSDIDKEALRSWQEANGRLPLPRVRVDSFADPSISPGVSQQESVKASRQYPREVHEALRRRDAFAEERLGVAHGWALGELRQDPMLTQDSLHPDAKSALARIDQALLAMNTHRRLDMLFEGEDHPALAPLKAGAKNRQRLRDQGREAAEEDQATRNAHGAWYGQAGTRDPITGEWMYGSGIRGENERRDARFQSDIDAGRINEQRRDRDESGETRQENVHNVGARYRAAQAMADRVAGLQPVEGVANAFIDENGQRVSLENLRGELTSFMAPHMQGELAPQIRRAQQGIRRNNPSSVERYRKQLRELEAQRESLKLSPSGSFTEQLASIQQVAQRYAAYRGSLLTDSVVDAERPEEARATEQVSTPVQTPASEEDAGVANTARGGRRKTAPSDEQASAAVQEAQQTVDGIKRQLADINARLARTREGSKNRQTLTARRDKLRQARTEANRELSRLQRTAESGSKSEHAAAPQGVDTSRGERAVTRTQAEYDAAIERALGQYENPEDFNPYNHDEVVEAEGKLKSAQAYHQRLLRDAGKQRAAAGGGGNGNKPPTSPAPPATPEPEEEPEPVVPPSARRRQSTKPFGLQSGDLSQADANRLSYLAPETQQALREARDRLSSGGLSRAEQEEVIRDASAAAHADPKFTRPNRDLWGIGGRSNALWSILGVDRQPGSGAPLARLYTQGREAAATNAASNFGGVQGAQSENELAGATERAARMEEILASASGKVREARLAELIAEENLARVRTNSESTTAQLARAEMQYSAAQRNSIAAQGQADAEANKSRYAQMTGRKTGTTFGQDLLRHGSYALENTIGYSLVFTGMEKLREVVQTGIEAQGVWVRLQASLDANGIAAGNLQTKMVQISATTATPMQHVIEAASELSGTLRNSADIEFGTNIAAQLANISQGALTAREAAVGLRDVIAAFGDEWAKSGMTMQQGMQAAGDQIAHLSQLTGVSVKDITEGTTQIAQEAKEFGLSQRQAATLAAYVTKGTGETGEQAASQTSRMLATLYNARAQRTLIGTRLYDRDGQQLVNRDGSPQTLATSQQFEAGQVGTILENIARHWDQLNPRQRQQISASMGTGIQARAFTAFVGGGARAADEMDATSNDRGALTKQNQSFLNTIAGQIKQLDENFQNLGVTLQRLGAFDVIGVLAKSVNLLFENFNKVFGGIARLMSSNPLTEGLMHWSVLLLEGAAAWKLFGGAATRALAGAGILRNVTPTNQAAINDARAAGTAVPRAQYAPVPFGTVARGVGGRIGEGVQGGATGIAGRAGAFGAYSRDVVVGRNFADLSPAGLGARGKVAAAETALASAVEARTKAELEAAASIEKKVVAENTEQEAAARLTAAEVEGAVSEERLNELRSAQAKATEDLIVATQESAAAQVALSEATAAATVATAEVAAASQAQAGVRSAGLLAGFRGAGGGLAGMAPMLGLGLIMGAGPLQKAIAGGESPGGGTRGYLGSAFGGVAMGTGLGLMVGGPLGGAIGAGAGAVYGVGRAFVDAKHKRDDIPSGASDQQFIDMLNLVYNNPHERGAQRGARKRLGYGNAAGLGIDDVDKMTSVSQVTEWQQKESDFINKHAKDIEAAGGNDKKSQQAIAESLNQLKDNLGKDAARRIGVLQGLTDIDQLNAQQTTALLSMSGTLGGLNADTLASQHAAVATLVAQTGLPTTSRAYQSLQQAMGAGVPLNTLGINDKGQVGQYSADGTWHGASRQVLEGIGPTEGTKLANLGKGPGAANGTVRLQALQTAYQAAINSANSKLADPASLSPQDLQTYTQNLTSAVTGYQQTTTALYQSPITQEQGRASILASLGGTPQVAASMGLGTGGDQAAIADLHAANDDLHTYNTHLEKTDPQYWQNLQQIQQNKLQIAQLQHQPELSKLMLAAAQATDATEQANDRYKQAVNQLSTDIAGGASSAQIGTDQANKAAAGVASRQTQEAVKAATANANISGVQNNVQRARAQHREALRLEGVYGKGGPLADKGSYEQAVGQANQSNIAIQDAIEAQIQSSYDARAAWQQYHGDTMGALYTQLAKAQQAYRDAVSRYGEGSQQANAAWGQIAQDRTTIRATLQANALAAYDVTAAIQNLHGDAVGAAATALSKAEQAYQQAITDYGKNSSQAREALAGVISSRQAYYNSQVEQVNSWLDLDVANLNARGQQGDAQHAAQDAVQKVRNQISSYLRHGGQKGTKEYNDLMGQLATAQRTAFDTNLQAQLDTLDFQQQTYKITSAQEVQSLQQILKNKQLTLQEQRDITLKIKNLQDSIRQQLTQGGLNIPSGIKLPTAYEVRRSLGAGFGGAGTQVNTVNNNQQVTVNNNVPNQQVATTIANQVIQLINQQTSMGLRSSSSTPRTVQTK